jgi:hypothetical protein
VKTWFAFGSGASAFVVALTLAAGCADSPPAPVHEATFRSKVYPIDRVYRSMVGPQGNQIVRLGDAGQSELIWITGYRTRIVRADGGAADSEEFMCHSNLEFADLAAHRRTLPTTALDVPRVFTLSQGQMDVRFPDGFGVPVASGMPLLLATQVLNLNPQPERLEVVHETTIEYVRDAELVAPMEPLFQTAAQGMVLVSGDDPYFGIQQPDPELHGPGCMVGAPAGERTISDGQGREFAAHWVVPPGRQENHTLVTNWMGVPYDTTIHQIAVHVHPFAESVALRDLDTGETVFESRMTQSEGRIGLDRVQEFSSEEGIPVYADHQYELISVYDNTTDEPQDAMAVMFLYMRDRRFEKPAWVRATPAAGAGGG